MEQLLFLLILLVCPLAMFLMLHSGHRHLDVSQQGLFLKKERCLDCYRRFGPEPDSA